MKTEAQKMRELLESLLTAGTVNLEEIYDVEEDHNMPDQRSTYDQLLDLLELATQNGLYDAADWLKGHLNQNKSQF